ncbi:erythroid differentiation-related factor 1-like [Tigriopus californicus]|uniref:erythroid differentiation-related factor 1-like n=1 Tax=Tigriopus californicus TaxID=6832 RepID=UPI0027DAA914|nr:erythroid differentiation-related factor 1-like [Tigriopus californicus]
MAEGGEGRAASPPPLLVGHPQSTSCSSIEKSPPFTDPPPSLLLLRDGRNRGPPSGHADLESPLEDGHGDGPRRRRPDPDGGIASPNVAMPGDIHPFSRLQISTNLNPPPRNWLHSYPSGVDHLQGFGATPHYTGFSSLRMAHHFVDFLREVDVVADAENIKKLLKIPYSNAPVSLVLHRVGNSILIDEFDIHGFLLRTSESEWKWLKKFFYDTVLTSVGEKSRALVRRNIRSKALQEQNLVSKFLYRSLQDGDTRQSNLKAITFDPSILNVSQTESEDRSAGPLGPTTPCQNALRLLPEPTIDGLLPDPRSSGHDFARNLVWNFEDIRMLIGSDLPIFGDADHPSVSLRLHNSKKPINILTGLDYWLDNLMCHIPEVLMCFHLDGIVQRYELVKTEDLPNLEGCSFSPKAVRDVAKNILSFIQSNAAREGHTYWLFKGKNDDFVKLYDLTSICEEAENQSTTTEDVKLKNPFRSAVAALLYRVARNMVTRGNGHKEGSTIRQLLESCLKLLDKEKHPELVTSAHFMLSEIYLPDDTDPFRPKFDETEDKPKRNKPSSAKKNNVSVIDIKSLTSPNCAVGEDEYYEPPPLPSETKERCRSALNHVVEGMGFLDELVQRQNEMNGMKQREQEMKERDNPRMCRPNEAIPMSFDDPKTRRQRAQSESSIHTMTHSSPKVDPSMLWHIHLKSVLLKKAFLVYITISELHFRTENYGSSLRCFKRALNCYKVVTLTNRQVGASTDSEKSFLLSFAFGLAADCYMAMVRNWNRIVNYQEEYNQSEDFDTSIANEIENHVEEPLRDWKIKLPQDMEDAIQKAISCLEHGISITDQKNTHASKEVEEDLESMISRLANAQNEMGVFYMHQANNLAGAKQEDSDNNDAAGDPVVFIIERSLACLTKGLQNFEKIQDSLNCALLHCNIGRAFKVKAYLLERNGGNSGDTNILPLYDQALKHYEQSIGLVGHRRKNPDFWDSITWEYSGTLYHIGSQLQTGSPRDTMSRDEAEKRVLECYKKALKSCDLTTDGPRQPLYQYRALKIHVGLAQLYSTSSAALSKDLRHNPRFFQLMELADGHYDCASQLAISLGKHLSHFRIQSERLCLYFVAFERLKKPRDIHTFVEKGLDLLVGCLPTVLAIESATQNENEDVEDGVEDSEVNFLHSFLIKKIQEFFLFVNQFIGSKKRKKESFPAMAAAKDLYSRTLRLPMQPNNEDPTGISGEKNMVSFSSLVDFLNRVSKEREVFKHGLL